MALPRNIALSEGEIEELLQAQWNLRVASIGPAGRINLTPMWFGWSGGAIYFYGRGQKIVNLRRNSSCTIIVDRNVKFPELQGVMMQGQAKVLEDAEAEARDPNLGEVRQQMGLKYSGGHGQSDAAQPAPFAATARGRNRRWVVLMPEHVVSWDNFKLAAEQKTASEPVDS